MIDVGKGVDATFGVIGNTVEHTIYHTRGSGCGCCFSRLEDIEREGIVGLISCTISYWSAFCQSEFLSRLATYLALNTEGGYNVCQHGRWNIVVIEQELCRLVFLEVPHHAFGKSAYGSRWCSGKSAGNVIAWQHYLIYFIKGIWFVFAHPCQFRRCEISGRVE